MSFFTHQLCPSAHHPPLLCMDTSARSATLTHSYSRSHSHSPQGLINSVLHVTRTRSHAFSSVPPLCARFRSYTMR
ncbi:hypothetical protein CABS01_05355 [Colletotrichum abscissum]|uniref:uncharacterized protein n=1 Tax=Colletotrichum abscissum TaxID=1671311 RepID=UPI0027D6EDF3|nr:uncharacterized protein CABS01_05355 [Colletotrichum abscissum]KAK1523734.1 hypothetical protein CABS01_05355 [Colletotrichum abscissum]